MRNPEFFGIDLHLVGDVPDRRLRHLPAVAREAGRELEELEHQGEPFAVYLLLGGALYLAGAILPTGVYHVPRNEALAEVGPDATEARDRWAGYLSGWMAWNHALVVASLAAAATLAVALRIGRVHEALDPGPQPLKTTTEGGPLCRGERSKPRTTRPPDRRRSGPSCAP